MYNSGNINKNHFYSSFFIAVIYNGNFFNMLKMNTLLCGVV